MNQTDIQTLIDAGTPVVEIPAGDYVLDWYVLVNRNLVLRGQGAATRLLIRNANQGIRVDSTLTSTAHASGQIAAGADSITADDPTPYAVGQWVFLRLGVSADDPHEAQDRAWMRILSITGNVLAFDSVFPESIPVYSNVPPYSWTTYPDRVGPYGTIPPSGGNLICRGFGLDHTIYAFSSVVDDVTVENLTVGLASDLPNPPQALWSLVGHWARNVRFRHIRVEDYIASVAHSFECVNMTLEDFEVLHGRPLGVQGQPPFPPALATSWGGRDFFVRNGNVRVPNLQLFNLDGGCRGLVIENVVVDAAHDPVNSPTVPTTFWNCSATGTSGVLPGSRLRDVTVRGVMNAAINQQLGDEGLTAGGVKFQCVLGNYADLRDFGGPLEMFGVRYREVRNQYATLTVPAGTVAGSPFYLTLPQGLYRRAFVRFDNPNAYAAILYPSSSQVYHVGTVKIPPAGLWVELTRFYQVYGSPSDPDRCYATPKQLKFYQVAPFISTTVTVDIDYWLPR